MNASEICHEIEATNCKVDLIEFLDRLQAMVDRNECTYNAVEAVFIRIAVQDKLNEFKDLVLH
jgi:hypothetical protein